jgi:hypothetical protein
MSRHLNVFVSDDPERDWPLVGPYHKYQWESYRELMVEGTDNPTPRPLDLAVAAVFPWLAKETRVPNHFYSYGVDRDFGPFVIKFCSYFPYTVSLEVGVGAADHDAWLVTAATMGAMTSSGAQLVCRP